MALSVTDIFPLPGNLTSGWGQLLEPKVCIRTPCSPTILSPTEAKVLFRKRGIKTFYRYEYDYENILQWEYIELENFFRRMKGRYTEFYLVDWSNPYRITARVSNSPGQLTLNHVGGLTSSTGYLGNKVLIYDAALYGQVNKQILTITGITTLTITVSGAIESALYSSARAKIYILAPAIFDCDDLKYSTGEFCIEEESVQTFGEFGAKYLYGPVISLNIPFIQLGTAKDI